MISLRLKRFGLGRSSASVLATAQPLELRPEFAAHAWMRLLETSLAGPSRTAQPGLRTSPRRAARVTILSSNRFYVPGRARLALR